MVTTFFFLRMADLMTEGWNVYGIKLTTTSFFSTSASKAFEFVTSRERGLAFLIPEHNCSAFSKVLHAADDQSCVILILDGQLTYSNLHTCISKILYCRLGDKTSSQHKDFPWN